MRKIRPSDLRVQRHGGGDLVVKEKGKLYWLFRLAIPYDNYTFDGANVKIREGGYDKHDKKVVTEIYVRDK